jgi:hypothetical protein
MMSGPSGAAFDRLTYTLDDRAIDPDVTGRCEAQGFGGLGFFGFFGLGVAGLLW